MENLKTNSRYTRQSDRFRLTLGRVLSMLVLVGGAVLLLIPLVWTFCMSLKPNSEMLNMNFWPEHPRLANFADVFNVIPFLSYLWNTVVILIPVMIGTVATSAMVGYGFSRFRFKGKRAWFLILLATMMLPGQITLIPQYLMFREFGWVNTPLPLIIPAFFGGGAFNIFLIRQFMNGIPKDIDEAAVIDGASRFTIFSKIIMPLSRPALTAIGVFTFIGVWNDFNGPLIYLNDSTKYTLTLGLSFFKGMYKTQWNELMAATVLVILPVLILFFCAQQYIIDGIVISSGTKG